MKQELTGLKALIDEVKAYVDEKLGGGEIGDYIVETYSDDDGNWYRLWKSGWCEQGGTYIGTTGSTRGITTFTFLLPLKELPKQIFFNKITYDTSVYSSTSTSSSQSFATTCGAILYDYPTNTNFQAQKYLDCLWSAKGYI